MPLPEILVPAGVPPYRAQAHARRRGNLHANVPMGTGHDRKEPIRTASARFATVSARLSAAAAVRHDAWYEFTLKVGTLAFAAPLFGLGTSSPQYWSATWVAPPKYDPVGGGFYIVTGELRLTGEPSLTPPESTSAAVEFSAPLLLTVEAFRSAYGEVEFGLALTQAVLASVEFAAALTSYVPSYELRDDGSFELRDDDTFELRDDDA